MNARTLSLRFELRSAPKVIATTLLVWTLLCGVPPPAQAATTSASASELPHGETRGDETPNDENGVHGTVAPRAPLPRLTVFATVSSFGLLSRASLSADFRLLSAFDDWVHLMANAGVGAVSFFFGPPNVDFHATAGLLLFPGAHHLELRGGAIAVSNSVAGDGPYLYPALQVGYRYATSASPLSVTALVGTTGLSVGLGWAF